MSKWKMGLCLLLTGLLQTMIFSNFSIFGARVNLLLVFTVAVAMIYGEKTGAYLGLGLGLLQDVVFSTVLGIHALIYFLVGTFVGRFLHHSSGHLPTAIFIVAVSTLFSNGLEWAISLLLRMGRWNLSYFKGPIFIELIVNAALFFVMRGAIKKFLKPDSVHKYRLY